MNAVIDEDLPRSLADTLSSLGFTVFDVRDHGLRGRSDDQIFAFAQKQKAVLFSGDLGFSNTLVFPLGKHHGICVLRFPNEVSVQTIKDEVMRLLSIFSYNDYVGNLIILAPGKVRLRRHKKETSRFSRRAGSLEE